MVHTGASVIVFLTFYLWSHLRLLIKTFFISLQVEVFRLHIAVALKPLSFQNLIQKRRNCILHFTWIKHILFFSFIMCGVEIAYHIGNMKPKHLEITDFWLDIPERKIFWSDRNCVEIYFLSHKKTGHTFYLFSEHPLYPPTFLEQKWARQWMYWHAWLALMAKMCCDSKERMLTSFWWSIVILQINRIWRMTRNVPRSIYTSQGMRNKFWMSWNHFSE